MAGPKRKRRLRASQPSPSDSSFESSPDHQVNPSPKPNPSDILDCQIVLPVPHGYFVSLFGGTTPGFLYSKCGHFSDDMTQGYFVCWDSGRALLVEKLNPEKSEVSSISWDVFLAELYNWYRIKASSADAPQPSQEERQALSARCVKEYRNAIDKLALSAMIGPLRQDIWVHFELAEAYRHTKRYRSAANHFRKVLDLGASGAFQEYCSKIVRHYDRIAATTIPQDAGFVGISIKDQKVETVFPGSPADAAGLETGDRITFIDGKDTSKMTDAQLCTAIIGQKGHEASIKIVRGGVESELKIPRAEPNKLTRTLYMLDKQPD